MSDHAIPPKEHRWQAWISLVATVVMVVVLVVIALRQTDGKGKSEDKSANLQNTATSLAEQVKRACAQGGQTAKDLGSACGQANQVINQPEVKQGERGLTGRQGVPGPQGPRGARGVPGAKGEPGAPGTAGVAGEPGPAGPEGVAGVKGDPGVAGADGAKGEPGPAGADGKNGVDGKDGPPGPTCPTGYGPASAMVLTADGPRDAIICEKVPTDG